MPDEALLAEVAAATFCAVPGVPWFVGHHAAVVEANLAGQQVLGVVVPACAVYRWPSPTGAVRRAAVLALGTRPRNTRWYAADLRDGAP